MKDGYNKANTCTVTGVFATREDAENAYHILMELGYSPDEITLIMSEKTQDKLYNSRTNYSGFDAGFHFDKDSCNTISDAIDALGKFVAFPGVALMVAGDFNDGGVRALTDSVMSDRYAQYYRTRINDGEIVIDFLPHTVNERNIISGIWEDFGGDPLIRNVDNAA